MRIHAALLLTASALALAGCKRSPEPAPDAQVDEDRILPVYPIGEAPPSPLAVRLCEAVQTLPAENAARCCGRGTVSKLVTGECVRMLSAALAADAVTVTSEAVDRCAEAMKAAHRDCTWVGGPWKAPVPHACIRIIGGTVKAGAPCRSSLECVGNLRCEGVGPTEGGVCAAPSPNGARCATAVDSLAVYTRQEWVERDKPDCAGRCLRHKCVSAVPVGEVCDSNAACGRGAHCAEGRCEAGATVPAGGTCVDGGCAVGTFCISGRCQPLKEAGQSCSSPFECRAGCVSADGGPSVCAQQCNAPLLPRAPRPGKPRRP